MTKTFKSVKSKCKRIKLEDCDFKKIGDDLWGCKFKNDDKQQAIDITPVYKFKEEPKITDNSWLIDFAQNKRNI